MSEQNRTGDFGESVVVEYLMKRGYTILARKFRCRAGELDIVARSPEDILCFVEVKTRRCDSLIAAREAVTPAKQHRLHIAAQWYLMKYADLDTLCRFDVAEVYVGRNRIPEIIYIPQAFES